MTDPIKSNKNYEILDGDDDVLLLGKATFTVRRFKELAASNFRSILDLSANDDPYNNKISMKMKELQINEET